MSALHQVAKRGVLSGLGGRTLAIKLVTFQPDALDVAGVELRLDVVVQALGTAQLRRQLRGRSTLTDPTWRIGKAWLDAGHSRRHEIRNALERRPEHALVVMCVDGHVGFSVQRQGPLLITDEMTDFARLILSPTAGVQ